MACVTSTTIAASGSNEKALVREPPKVVSSWAAATATTSQSLAPPASATSRAASSATNEPSRLSSAREAILPLGSSTGSPSITATSPILHEVARLRAVLGADVDVQVAHLGHLLALLLAQQVNRLLADHPRDLAARAWRSRRRWPTRIWASQPPTSRNHR